MPQCQKVTVFSVSSMETGSPKKAAFPESWDPMYMDSAPYVSDSQLATVLPLFSSERTAQTGVP